MARGGGAVGYRLKSDEPLPREAFEPQVGAATPVEEPVNEDGLTAAEEKALGPLVYLDDSVFQDNPDYDYIGDSVDEDTEPTAFVLEWQESP